MKWYANRCPLSCCTMRYCFKMATAASASHSLHVLHVNIGRTLLCFGGWYWCFSVKSINIRKRTFQKSIKCGPSDKIFPLLETCIKLLLMAHSLMRPSASTKHKSDDVFIKSLQCVDTQRTAVSGGAPGSDVGATVWSVHSWWQRAATVWSRESN